jgi:DNA-binding MarR family transcriptional regulator
MPTSFAIDHYDPLFAARVAAQPVSISWAEIRAFRDSPTFINAVLRYDAISGPFYANQFILNKVVPEAWRFQMIVFLLHLHDTRDWGDPRSGLTLANFQRVCAHLGLASAGRAMAFLNIMRVGGYLARSRSEADGRIVHLEPTPRFIATVEQWNDGIFALIDTAMPPETAGAGLVAARARYPALGRDMRRISAEKILAGWKPLAAFPEVERFAARDGGWMLLARAAALTLAAQEGAPVSIDLAAFAREFGTSRTQLRRILESAFDAGLLDAPPANGAYIRLSSALVCAFAAWLAGYLASYYDSAERALAAATEVSAKTP